MTKLDLGRLGLGLTYEESTDFLYAVAEAEQIGFPTVWISGGELPDLDAIGTVARATGSVGVASGIIPVDRFDADQTSAFFTEMEAVAPGRFTLGLGGAHGAHGAHGSSPLTTLNEYLDEIDETVPADRRMLAALGPKMLELAGQRTSGALTVLVTPEHTGTARNTLGADATLAVQQLAVVEPDVDQARETARGTVSLMLDNPVYVAHARRMGFDDSDIEQVSDQLVDALVPSGDVDAVAGAIELQYAAGADHVVVSLLNSGRPVEVWRELYGRL